MPNAEKVKPLGENALGYRFQARPTTGTVLQGKWSYLKGKTNYHAHWLSAAGWQVTSKLDDFVVVWSLRYVQPFYDHKDCSPPGSSVGRISQAQILKCVAICFSRGSSRPRDRTWVSCIAGGFLPTEPPGKPSGLRHRHLLSHRFCRSRIWACLSWVLYFRITPSCNQGVNHLSSLRYDLSRLVLG